MRAMILETPGDLRVDRLKLVEAPRAEPGRGEVRLRMAACGVCRTDLHLVDGTVPVPSLPLIPGHQAVGFVEAAGKEAKRFREGDRIGVSWLHSACGVCPFCSSGRENLCPRARFTGFHTAGGYADTLVVPEAYGYTLPPQFGDSQAAPLLCAGVLGFRALRLSGAARGEVLGLVGFGASAHLALQVARHLGCDVQVATRSENHRALARQLGASFAGDLGEVPPATWNAAILFAPAGSLIPAVLGRLRPGGTLAVAALYLGTIPELDYEKELLGERVLRSVTASTRRDAEEFLEIAASLPVRTDIEVFPLEAANDALRALRASELAAAAVLRISS